MGREKAWSKLYNQYVPGIVKQISQISNLTEAVNDKIIAV